jgi:polysaccharide biosynthesis protein PslH
LTRSALLLAAETPYPMAGGGALRTASLLHYLAQRYDTDLLVFRQPGEDHPENRIPAGLARRVEVLDLPLNRRTPSARAARNMMRLARGIPPLTDRFAGFDAAIAATLDGRRYDVGIVEHFWCAPYWPQIAAVCSRTVLDLHNVESILHHRCAETEGGATAFAHRRFAGAARRLERIWLPRFGEVLVTSEQDAASVRAIAPKARTLVYPNAIPFAPLPATGSDEAIVFSGNMEYHPNRSAVAFFRREVWPLLRAAWPELVWRLVGKNPGAVQEFTSGDSRIEVRGAVDDAIAELARCRAAVAPLLAGSGTRLKILEAWAAGLPVISTSIGAEGLGACPGEHLLIADSAAAFAAAVTRVLACNDLRASVGKAGRLLLEKEFTWETAWSNLDF